MLIYRIVLRKERDGSVSGEWTDNRRARAFSSEDKHDKIPEKRH